MKKRNIIVFSISILSIICFITILVFGSNKKTFIENGVTYALTVDGNYQNSFPAKGMYRVDTECNNATCKWDYDNWKLYIEEVEGKVTCNISFNTITKTNFNNYIIGLLGTTQGTGKVANEKGYRYEGQDPNNYVWFNNELWRIIGVFDSTSHGQTGLNLVKIIRNEPLGGLVWNKSNTNDWNVSSLKALLNTEYLNSQNGTNGSNCYGYATTSKEKCDYTIEGIQDKYRSMIKEVTWYLGGHETNAATAEAFYTAERGDTVYSERPTNGTGKIGLMYMSDYGYAVPAENCARTTNLNAYSNTDCTLNNWLYGGGYNWTITPNSASLSNAFYVIYNGNTSNYSVNLGYGVQPTLYLESSVYVIDGDGSKTNPYVIGM